MVISLVGDNQHQVRAELKAIVEDFKTKHGPLSVERFDASEVEAEHILSAIQASSLFNSQKLVVVNDFESNKLLIDKTESVLEAPEDTTVVLVIGKLDKRATYGKLLKKESDWQEFANLSAGDTVSWITKEAEYRGGKIDRQAAQYLIDFVGTDQTRLGNELDKLILFDSNITRPSIDQLSEKQPTATIFELLDASFGGQAKKAIELYDNQRRQQVEPLKIMSMIAWQLHILAIAKTAKGRPAAEIAKDAGVHPFVVQKSMTLARRLTMASLRGLVHRAVQLETDLKSRTINADDAIKHYLLSLTTS